jgi:hypothetical protein
MTLVMTWFTNVKRGVGPAVDFWYSSMRPPASPPSSLPPAALKQAQPCNFQTAIKKPAGKGGFFKRQG